jgi:hypothetical protein
MIHRFGSLAPLAYPAFFKTRYVPPEVPDLLCSMHGFVEELPDFDSNIGVLNTFPDCRVGFEVPIIFFQGGGGGVGIDFRLSFSRDLQDMMRESLDLWILSIMV